MVNTYSVPEKEIRMRGVECLRVPGWEPALKTGNERLADMVRLKALEKALYPALDVRYHSMIPANQNAMDMGAESVRNERG